MDAAVGTHDIWVFDVSRGLPERFTFDPADDFGPNWSRPDGDRIVFSSRRAGSIDLYEKPIKGSAAGERLVLHDPLGKFNARFSPDSRYLLYVCGGGIIARSDLCIMPLTGTRKPAPFLDSPFVETQGQFSPDGRWVAYTSSESSQEEVYITPFPAHDAKWRVSTAGGSRPRWNPKGGEIFYLAPDNTLMSSAVTLEAVPVISAAHALFQIHPRQLPRLDALSYDVAADGRRFLVNRAVDEPQATTLMLIVNWPR
jgi:Tol biopolymer transport system component